MLKPSSLKIDPEFSAQILPLSFEELQQLEHEHDSETESLTESRSLCGTTTILDGHNRYNILRKHSALSNMRSKKWSFPASQEALASGSATTSLGGSNLTARSVEKYLIGKAV